ncbi:DUF805 domain-containing protein [Veillonella sp. R32]|uniref:DUF805 domain-containing protein n=1 Tax=Veillonella sp. R32 TaxID=2021312 RepID=UPI00192E96AA|nr:DUF805 domain-containing protein [Veillonella sp. R32]
MSSLPIVDNFKMCMTKKYMTFQGRASRGEYWKFVLVQFIIMLIVGIIAWMFTFDEVTLDIITTLVGLPFLLPSLAVQVRRLHDLGRSAWWLLLHLVPYAGSFVLFIFSIMKGKPEANEYGPVPNYSYYGEQ